MYKKIDLGTARKLYNTETNIYMLPSKMKVDNIWFSPVLITPQRKKSHTFDQVYNEFFYYNCNSEMGKRINFYIKEN